MFLICETHMSYQSPPLAIYDKTTKTNEHMKEVINHSTHTLEKLCKKRVYGKYTLTTCISKAL